MVNLAEYYKYQISRESLQVSQEYNALDWPRLFFGGWNQLVRFVDKGNVQVKMEGFEAWVFYLLGKVGTFGYYATIVGDVISSFNLPIGIANYIKYKNVKEANDKSNNIMDKVPNVYNLLYNKTSSIDWNDPNTYRTILDGNIQIVEKLMKECQLSEWRDAKTDEINSIKLIKPKYIENDIMKLNTVFDNVKHKYDSDIVRQWEKIIKDANDLAKRIIKYITDNVRDSSGYMD